MPPRATTIPFDATITLLRDPYRYIGGQCRALGQDLFATRFLLRRTICLSGPEAARVFYDTTRLRREGAMPGAIVKTLLGRGGVQGLDDAAHAHRKRLFMAMMTPESITALTDEFERGWWRAMEGWGAREEIVLYPELCTLLTRSVCAWADVPLAEGDVGKRTAELTLLFDAAGAKSPRHLQARLARRGLDRWAATVVAQRREHDEAADPVPVAHSIAWHRDGRGALLDERVAGVELLNVLRPTVAIAVYVVLLAHALHRHPEAAAAAIGEAGERAFVQEVRRFYPFFPATAARVREDFTWRGHAFPRGARVLLDLYGTDHDARTWGDPETFRPARFLEWEADPFDFVPQGGGDHVRNHRCAGEWLTVAVMRSALRLLRDATDYEVPEQALEIDLSRLPALPPSGFRIRRVRARPTTARLPAERSEMAG